MPKRGGYKNSVQKSGKKMQAAVEYDDSKAGKFQSMIYRNLVPIIIFIAALFFIITFTNPGLFVTDEWITANQLHQLDIGHQAIANEGKYGVYPNGTPSAYMAYHGNNLGYTLALPIVTLPALKFFGLFGDNFRYFVLLLWACLPVIAALLVQAFYPKKARLFRMPILYLALPVALLLFIINLADYSIFPYSAADAPKEVAAIVFTQHIIFALMAVVVYKIFSLFSGDKKFLLFGTVATIACSSYIFWSGNTKDHLLFAFLFSLFVYYSLKFILRKGFMDAMIAFLLIGLALWVRAEVGVAIFIMAAILYVAYVIRDSRVNKDKSSMARIIAPLAAFVGAIPFMLNNWYVMGNPFKPTVFSFSKADLVQPGVTGALSVGNATELSNTVTSGLAFSINNLLSYYLFSIDWLKLPSDMFYIIFLPQSGSMGLLPLIPLFVAGIVMLAFMLRARITIAHADVMAFLICISIAVVYAYLYAANIMQTDQGIAPDMRYLSPIYLPLNIIGILLIKQFFDRDGWDWGPALKQFAVSALILIPVLIVAFLIWHPFGGYSAGYVLMISIIAYAMILVTVAMSYLTVKGSVSKKSLMYALILLAIIPLLWQMLELFIFAAAKFNGYDFWIPVVNNIYDSVFSVKR